MDSPIPPELEPVRERVLRIIQPLKPLDSSTEHDPKRLFLAGRTNAGRELPPYYLVYFLLVDLLGFEKAGRWEKTAWSVAVDWHGRGFLVEHRKMGVGVFAQDVQRDEPAAHEIVIKIQKAVRAAQPFFEWLARDAVARSAVNVVNNASSLFDRYTFLRDFHKSKREEYESRKRERVVTEGTTRGGGKWTQSAFPAFRLTIESDWLALSAVEAFFAWTEHVFIHLAVLLGRTTTADEIAKLAEADWTIKFQSALDLVHPATKAHYDRLLGLRRELRNFVAHGAFGKQGEAFSFHSGAGAVPVLLPHSAGSRKFKFGHGLSFRASDTLSAMEDFVAFLWSAQRAPAEVYIQQSELPLILTCVRDGSYARAMQSVEDMTEFVTHLTGAFDRASDMDW